MKSEIVEKKPEKSFKPINIMITLDSEKDLFALSAIFNHGVVTGDLSDHQLFILLDKLANKVPGGNNKNIAAFEELDERLKLFT